MISEVFIRRPVTAIVISLIIVLVGTIAMLNLPVSKYPQITPPLVRVASNYIGADAQTVEQNVATLVETQVNGTPGMTYLKSNSTNTGQMVMDVNFDVGTNIDIATLDVQNRVSIAEPRLPEEVRMLGLTVRKRDPTLLMVIAFYSPNGTHGVNFIENYANLYVRDALLRVPGVGDIETVGEEFSMRIWLKPDKLSQLGISAAEVTAALREQNVQVAAGAVGASPQFARQVFEYPITVNGKINSTKEFERIIVHTKPEDGAVVYLKDVARLELGRYNYGRQTYLVNNQSCVFLLYQTPGSNAISTADRIDKELKSLSKSFPADFDYFTGFDSVTVVKVSIKEVIETMGEALLLVILVVFLFLQSWRATLITVLAIPVSLVGTFIFFIPLDFTINTLTLFGFVLAIGIVVDDAIVVVEAVQHYIDEDGLSPKEATRKAMGDITGPVIAIALILAAVFIPVGFIPGIVGRLYQQFAITIAISVMISAFVALTLTPALCSILLRPAKLNTQSKGINRFFYWFNEWFARVTKSYSTWVQSAIKATPLVLVMLACLYVGTFALFQVKPTGFIPTEDEGLIYISFELPEAASSVRTREVVKEIGSVLESQPGIEKFTSIAGLNFITFANKSNSGTYFLQLKHWDERKDPSLRLEAIIEQLQQKLAAVKEANIVVVSPPAIPGLGQTGGFSFVLQQRESTDDIKGFENVMNTFLAELRKRPEIGLAFSFFTAKTPSYRVEVDREKVKKLGVSLADVFSTISTYMGSQYINDFTLYGRTFRVVAQADTSYRNDIRDLGQYYVLNSQRERVPLSALASYQVEESAPVLAHYNLFRSTEINGNPAPGYSSGQAIKALQEVAGQVLPNGYGYEFSGLSREELASGNTTVLIFALSIMLVFLLLAALYESWSVPFSVLLAVPLGAFGAILTLTILPQLSNNVYAQIGLVTLIGLSAKNAILIVEFAKERVDHGENIVEATLQAVKLRLRPIIMTSLAFILGVLPLAFSVGAGAVARQTIGWTVVGGMLAATFLAIFAVPVLFLFITRLAYGERKLRELESGYQATGKNNP